MTKKSPTRLLPGAGRTGVLHALPALQLQGKRAARAIKAVSTVLSWMRGASSRAAA